MKTSLDGYQSEWYEINKSKSEDIPSINIFEKNDHKKDTSSFPSLFSQNFQPISFFGINSTDISISLSSNSIPVEYEPYIKTDKPHLK